MEKVFHSDGGQMPQVISQCLLLNAVADLSMRLKKLTASYEGRLQVMLEADAVDTDVILKMRDLFILQQGRVLVEFVPDLSVTS